jgi:hypothetical protein
MEQKGNRSHEEHESKERDEPPAESFYVRILIFNDGAEHRLKSWLLAIKYCLGDSLPADKQNDTNN